MELLGAYQNVELFFNSPETKTSINVLLFGFFYVLFLVFIYVLCVLLDFIYVLCVLWVFIYVICVIFGFSLCACGRLK